MNIKDYIEQREGLVALYRATRSELESMDGWESFESSWGLRCVCVMNDGTLVAVVHYHRTQEEQWVGVSWENVTERMKKAAKNT